MVIWSLWNTYRKSHIANPMVTRSAQNHLCHPLI